MAETPYRCEMAQYQHEGSDKVWGAVVLKHSTTSFQYGSAWGRRGGHITSKLQPVGSRADADHRYTNATRTKVSDGYKTVPFGYDTGLWTALNNLIDTTEYTDAELVKEMLDKAGIPDLSKKKKTKPPFPKPSVPLPDLPCTASTCGHWLNVHATPSEAISDKRRFCLVNTCQCEQYRRTCIECGWSSVSAWTHAKDCLTGPKELDLPTAKEKPTTKTPTIYVRQPRRIMHLISDD